HSTGLGAWSASASSSWPASRAPATGLNRGRTTTWRASPLLIALARQVRVQFAATHVVAEAHLALFWINWYITPSQVSGSVQRFRLLPTATGLEVLTLTPRPPSARRVAAKSSTSR